MKEEWRNLEFMGYPNYEVSNLGEVYSLNHGFISENRINKQGYRRVRLYANGKKKEMLVHRLVAFAFVDNPNKEEWNIVNHKDENKLNNRFDNLEWCTNEYNLTYGTAIQRRVETKFKNGTWNCDELKEINRKPVFKYDFNGSIIEKFISQTDCYAKDRVNSQILSSDVPMRRGYVYSYRDDITVDDILHMVEIVKKSYDDKMIKAYQYDYDCNLVAIHDDINKLDYNIYTIKECIENERKFYNKYIWSSFELDEEELEIKIEATINNTRVRPVYQYTKDLDLVKAWNTTSDANKAGFPTSPVSECCRGIRKSYKGYIWSYRKIK